MQKLYTNKWNRVQLVTVVRNEGKHTLVLNEEGVPFYAVTEGLRPVLNKQTQTMEKQIKIKDVKVTDSKPNDKQLIESINKLRSQIKQGTSLNVPQIKKVLSVVFKGCEGRNFKRKVDETGLKFLIEHMLEYRHVGNANLVEALKSFKHAKFEKGFVRMNLKEYNSFNRVITRNF